MDELLNSSDAVVIIDAFGTIKLWNRGATILFGFESDEMIGNNLVQIMPERHRKAHIAGLKACNSSMQIVGDDITTFALKKDGTEFPCIVYVINFQFEEESYFLGFMKEGKFPKAVQNEMKLLKDVLHPILESVEQTS